MASTSVSPRQTLQDGAVLVVNRAVRVANFPLAREVARHVRKAIVALKPDELQGPKDNDMSARELAACIGKLLDFLDKAADETGSDVNMSEDTVEYLLELEQLRSGLHRSLSELRYICGLGYPTKLASQNRIRGYIQDKKERLMQTKFNVLMCLTMFSLSTGLQNAHTLSQTVQTVQWLVESHGALQLRQDWLDDRVNAVRPMRRTDEHERASLACDVPIGRTTNEHEVESLPTHEPAARMWRRSK